MQLAHRVRHAHHRHAHHVHSAALHAHRAAVIVRVSSDALPLWLAAGGTLVLAVAVAWLGFKTRSIAEAAKGEAEATRGLASEVRAELDRLWRPILAVKQVGTPSSAAGAAYVVTNVGAGPALDCQIFQVTEDGSWSKSGVLVVGAASDAQADLVVQQGEPPWELFVPLRNSPDQTARVDLVVYCFDGAGSLWRLVPGKGTERWRPSSIETPPPWAAHFPPPLVT